MDEVQAKKAGRVGDLGVLRHKMDDAIDALSMRTQPAGDEFARFFTQSPDLLCVASFDGHLDCLNPAWTSGLGWSLEDLKAKSFLELAHPDDYVSTLAEMARLADGAETILYENRYRHRDGSYRWIQWTAHLAPEHQQIYAIGRDVTRQKRLEAEVLEIADQEKERLGRELHDGLCQTLAGIAALSATLSKSVQANIETTASAAEEISILLTAAVKEARNLAHGLGSFNMATVGLDGALANLVINVRQLFRVSCTLIYDLPPCELCHEARVHLFRIAQEAVNNAVIHGRAEQIEISLTEKNGTGQLCIRDDGLGMSGTVANPDGIGMYTMNYRARLIGGSLEVHPGARCGTAVICEFPIRDKSNACEDAELVANRQ